jgi:hypothetical protein
MSHMTPVKWSPSDLDLLLELAKEQGFEVLTGTRARFYNGATKECDVCLRHKSSEFDISLTKFVGRYVVEYDKFSNHGDFLTQRLRDIHEEYVVRSQMRVAQLNGYRVTRQKNNRGQTQLVATRRR